MSLRHESQFLAWQGIQPFPKNQILDHHFDGNNCKNTGAPLLRDASGSMAPAAEIAHLDSALQSLT
jgi:hypothetical protein